MLPMKNVEEKNTCFNILCYEFGEITKEVKELKKLKQSMLCLF